jgi:hypothetical protein
LLRRWDSTAQEEFVAPIPGQASSSLLFCLNQSREV